MEHLLVESLHEYFFNPSAYIPEAQAKLFENIKGLLIRNEAFQNPQIPEPPKINIGKIREKLEPEAWGGTLYHRALQTLKPHLMGLEPSMQIKFLEKVPRDIFYDLIYQVYG